jgi:hypothetical protein
MKTIPMVKVLIFSAFLMTAFMLLVSPVFSQDAADLVFSGDNPVLGGSGSLANRAGSLPHGLVGPKTSNMEIIIESPLNTTYTTGNIDYNITVSENISLALVSIDAGTNSTMTNDSSTHYYNLSANHPTLSEGLHNASFFVNDTQGNANSTIVYFTVDTTSPTITIDSPENTTYNTSSVWFNTTLNQAGMCHYSIDLGSNLTMFNDSSSHWYALNTSVADGTHAITFFCNDTYGNQDQSSQYFTVDTNPPVTITIWSPKNTTYNTKQIELNVTAGKEIDTWLYSLNGGANQTFVPNTVITGKEGPNHLIVYANDSYGEWGSAQVYFTVQTVGIGIDVIYPKGDINVTRSDSFNVTLLVTCFNADCGDINVSLDPELYKYKRQINITSNVSNTLESGYTVNFSINTKELVNESKMQESGNDLRVFWYKTGEGLVELDRINLTPFNTKNTIIAFSLQENISPYGVDSNYWVTYGNHIAGEPPSKWSEVFYMNADGSFETSDGWTIYDELSVTTIENGTLNWHTTQVHTTYVYTDIPSPVGDFMLDFDQKLLVEQNSAWGVKMLCTVNYGDLNDNGDGNCIDQFSQGTSIFNEIDDSGHDKILSGAYKTIWYYFRTYRLGSTVYYEAYSDPERTNRIGYQTESIGLFPSYLYAISSFDLGTGPERYSYGVGDNYKLRKYMSPEPTLIISNETTTGKGLVSTKVGDIPFYTNGSNPRTVNLTEGESEEVVYYVFASGSENTTHTFYAYANLTSNMSINNITDTWEVTIIQEWDPPEVKIISPLNKKYNINVSLETEIKDKNGPEACWYSLDGWKTNITYNCSHAELGLSEGAYTIRVGASDYFGNINDTEWVTFMIDKTLPVITVYSPQNKTYGYADIDLNFSVLDSLSGVDSCWYSLDSGEDVELPYCYGAELYNLGEGPHEVIVYANDTAGNVGSEQVNFRVDAMVIGIEAVSPQATVVKDELFNVTLNVSCWNTDCGDVIISLDPYVTVQLPAIEDTYGDQGDPNSVKGGLPMLELKQSSFDEKKAAVKFDVSLLPEDNVITNAVLYLYRYSTDSYGLPACNAEIYGSDDLGWSEDLVTWNNFISQDWLIGNKTLGDSQTGSDIQGWVEFNVTSWVVSKYKEGAENVSIVLDPVSGFSEMPIFRSREYVQNMPYMEITYRDTKEGLISTQEGEVPFYTTGDNPVTVNLKRGESKLVVFEVNATGGINTTHVFYGYANASLNMSKSGVTDMWTVTIVPEGPEIVSVPPEKAWIGKNYSYDVEAVGYGELYYKLGDHPQGMEIDSLTGLINWDPDKNNTNASWKYKSGGKPPWVLTGNNSVSGPGGNITGPSSPGTRGGLANPKIPVTVEVADPFGGKGVQEWEILVLV